MNEEHESSREEVAAILRRAMDATLLKMDDGGLDPRAASDYLARKAKDFTERAGFAPVGGNEYDPFEDKAMRLTLKDLLTPPADRDFLLERNGPSGPIGFLPRGKVGLLIGEGGAGKTMVLTQMALSVATGLSLYDTFDVPRRGKVLIALGEEDEVEVQRRFYYAFLALAERIGADASAMERLGNLVCDNIVPIPLENKDVAFINAGKGTSERTLRLAQCQGAITKMGGDVALVILDPLSRFAGAGNENDNGAATALVQAFETLTSSDSKPTVVVGHHTNKGSRGAGEANAANGRGASALSDGARWSWEIARHHELQDGTETILATHVKRNYSPRAPNLVLARRRQGVLGTLSGNEQAQVDAAEMERKQQPSRPKGQSGSERRAYKKMMGE